jgi:adenosine deaminase CECR1
MRIFFLLLLSSLLLFACRSTQDAADPAGEEDYLSQRASWLRADQRQRFSAGMELTEAEQALNQQLVKLQEEMRAQYRKDHFSPVASNFYLVKAYMERTRLFQLLKSMPKGGILHAHDSALGSAWYIVDEAIRRENCYVFWEEDNETYVKGQLQFFKAEEVPEGFVPTRNLAARDEQFRHRLHDLLTFGPEVYADSFPTWLRFEQMFQRRLGFLNYRPVFADYLEAAFDSLLADGVQHIELRSIINPFLYDLQHEPGYYNRDSMLVAFQEAYQRVKQKYPEASLKLVYTGLRFLTRPIVCADLATAFRMRQAYPDLVVGYDLVGEEDNGFPTLHHLDCWDNLDSLEAVYGVDMPLFLHDGESNLPDNQNLYDALLLNTRRIGHGFNLYRFPELEDKVRREKVCLEICPLSNQILRYLSDLRVHPAVSYLSRGIPLTLSSDDPSIFAYEGLTYDFWAACVAWGLDLADLKQLAFNSLEYSSLEGEEKAQAIARWQQSWQQWVEESGAESVED